MRKQRKPPYSGKLFMQMPDGAERGVKLPSVEGVEIGTHTTVEYNYKNLPIRIPLVRVDGGWEIWEKGR